MVMRHRDLRCLGKGRGRVHVSVHACARVYMCVGVRVGAGRKLAPHFTHQEVNGQYLKWKHQDMGAHGCLQKYVGRYLREKSPEGWEGPPLGGGSRREGGGAQAAGSVPVSQSHWALERLRLHYKSSFSEHLCL